MAVKMQIAAAPRETEAAVEPVVVAEGAPEPYVPVANKPFQHGLQSLMRVVQTLSPDEAFGFEPAPSVEARPPIQRSLTSASASLLGGRRLTAVT
jgi:hypothetical protein